MDPSALPPAAELAPDAMTVTGLAMAGAAYWSLVAWAFFVFGLLFFILRVFDILLKKQFNVEIWETLTGKYGGLCAIAMSIYLFGRLAVVGWLLSKLIT